MIKRRGFTLIESLAVIAILGVLAGLGSYVVSQALRQARDTQRKTDLNAIAQAFEARYLDKTCSDATAVNYYPGTSLRANQTWTKTSSLASYTDGCGAFSKYLPTIPNDTRHPTYNYFFNLSNQEVIGSNTLPAVGKHYRLAASLERQFAAGSSEQTECVRLSGIWVATFGGQPYDCSQNIIGLGHGTLVSAAAQGQTNTQTGGGDTNTGGTGDTGTSGTICQTQVTQPDGSVITTPTNNCTNGTGDNGNGTGGNGDNGSGGGNTGTADYNYYIGR